jgi:predicted 2-oxoglutarate/Fe(II)-dependent dioxygenase YbiX
MPKEAVNHPQHYAGGGIEVIDAIEAWQLGFHLGNVVKYIARAEHKGTPIQDLKKARWYLDREISRREKLNNRKTT